MGIRYTKCTLDVVAAMLEAEQNKGMEAMLDK